MFAAITHQSRHSGHSFVPASRFLALNKAARVGTRLNKKPALASMHVSDSYCADASSRRCSGGLLRLPPTVDTFRSEPHTLYMSQLMAMRVKACAPSFLKTDSDPPRNGGSQRVFTLPEILNSS
ncbi:Uncharacterised protein [BD1-7 clade bacterium]|uniref:Uncharacterized protein n=1 Tax=BD1-7 clade bacterium TaxID=2029982 RepID=A0A5S9NUJ1_9GAMM|nr:Uncharacterised protein [BD1-7 clade bacterium]CAA0094384.1 Uncharacterised protein [BD1-7 clade bacterium]